MNKSEFLAMDLKHKIGQTAIVRVRPDNPEMGDDYEKVFEEYGYGGFFLGAEIIHDNGKGREDIKREAEALRARSKIPPLICGDAEAGFRNILNDEDNYPEMMAVGAANDIELAYEYGKANALECTECGMNFALAPIVDININPFNSVINNRAIGDSAEKALPLLESMVKGMQDNGLMANLKTFPGDGADWRDHHFVKTSNNLGRDDWYREFGNVYKRLFECGAFSVMIGHIALPWYQKGSDYENLPATLSKELIDGLLKKELGFKGMVLSDALEMGGYEQEYRNREKSEIESFKAGMDMMLWPSRNYFENMEKAVLSGEISEERLNDALERIWEIKNRAGCFKENFAKPKKANPDVKKYADGVCKRIAEKSVTLLRDCNNIFAGGKLDKIAIVTESPNRKGYDSMARLKKLFENEGIKVDLYENGVDENWQPRIKGDKAKEYDMIILAMYMRPHEPLGMLDFPERETVGISKVVNLPTDKLVSLSCGSPYVHKQYCERVPACVNIYGDGIWALKAFADAVTGKVKFSRNSPVKVF